jgi:hypothetical protein
MDANVDLNKFLIEIDKIDLKNQKVGIKSIDLNDTKASTKPLQSLKLLQKAIVKADKKLDTLVSSNPNKTKWSATLGRIKFVNDDIKFDNEAQKANCQRSGFCTHAYNETSMQMPKISLITRIHISGKINSFTFSEKSGLKINKFHTTFFYGPTNAYINDLLVETPRTVLQKQVQVSYPSIDAITKNIGLLRVNANLDGTGSA